MASGPSPRSGWSSLVMPGRFSRMKAIWNGYQRPVLRDVDVRRSRAVSPRRTRSE